VFGRSIGALLEPAIKAGGPQEVQMFRDEVQSLVSENESVGLQCKSGLSLQAKAVVIATGNFPPATPKIPGLTESSKRYASFVGAESTLEGLPQKGTVLLLGSGLTSLDLTMALKSGNFRGRIYIVSRHGLLPRRHEQLALWPQFWDEYSPRTTRGLLRLIRDEARLASESGNDWRAVIDALRPATQKMWRSLPLDERRRFLRHLRSYWEVHRHRIAPVADILADLIHEGQVRIYAGRISRYQERPQPRKLAYAFVELGVLAS
jgi:uncharacterized NAD(P)/FAD-binding protein YdhS